MQDLEPIMGYTRLNQSDVYQINNILYRYLYSDPYARPDCPRFLFRPLAGQRKKADLTLNKHKIHKVYLVPGYQAKTPQVVEPQGVQLALF
ncbi:MAG: hypothetical protein QNJ36_01240 [Calothrix sp. MO_167.B42]|nr:hypothetical protein [Calothrix sp. MO_167.B42]